MRRVNRSFRGAKVQLSARNEVGLQEESAGVTDRVEFVAVLQNWDSRERVSRIRNSAPNVLQFVPVSR